MMTIPMKNTAEMTIDLSGAGSDGVTTAALVTVSRDIDVEDAETPVLSPNKRTIEADFSDMVPAGYRCIGAVPESLSNVTSTTSGFQSQIMKLLTDGPVITWQLKWSQYGTQVYASGTREQGGETITYFTAGATLICVRDSE